MQQLLDLEREGELGRIIGHVIACMGPSLRHKAIYSGTSSCPIVRSAFMAFSSTTVMDDSSTVPRSRSTSWRHRRLGSTAMRIGGHRALPRRLHGFVRQSKMWGNASRWAWRWTR